MHTCTERQKYLFSGGVDHEESRAGIVLRYGEQMQKLTLLSLQSVQSTMDMVLEILQTINSQPNALTMRHIAHQTGIAMTSLVGVMMSMLNQGYVVEILSVSDRRTDGQARCTCACCRRKTDAKTTTSLDRRMFWITPRGVRYIGTWSGKSGQT